MKTTKVLFVFLLVIVIGVCSTGCVHSYYDLRIDDVAAGDVAGSGVVKGRLMLDVMRLEKMRTLFYSRDFAYIHRSSDGDRFHLWGEAICRLPTVLMELPFFLLSIGEESLPLTVVSRAAVESKNLQAPLKNQIPYGHSACSIINGLDAAMKGMKVEIPAMIGGDSTCKGQGLLGRMTYCHDWRGGVLEIDEVMNSSLWIYFTGPDECYVALKEFKYEARYFCGIDVSDDGLIPFLWRIDLKTGRCELVACFEKGKVTYVSRHA